MKAMFLLGAIALGFAAPANAQLATRTTTTVTRSGPDRLDERERTVVRRTTVVHRDRGHHYGWRNHHRRVCRNVWRNHHRVRRCWWR